MILDCWRIIYDPNLNVKYLGIGAPSEEKRQLKEYHFRNMDSKKVHDNRHIDINL